MRQLSPQGKLSHKRKAVTVQTEILFLIRFGFRQILVSRCGAGPPSTA